MNNSISIIGGADRSTSIFLGGRIGISWLNIFGLILVVLLLVPNIIYAIKENVDYIWDYIWDKPFTCYQ